MTINLHDLTGQESGIILVETDDGRHMNMVANWGAKDGLPYLFEPMLEPFSFLFLPSEDVHVETERIHSGALNDEIAHDGLEDWNPLDDDLDSDEPCEVYPLSNGWIIVNFPDRDTIRIVRIQYELVEDNTVLNTSDMGEEQALSELSRLLAAPMPRTDRLIWLKDQFDKTAEWWRNTIGGEQMAKDTDDMAERYMHVCENCNKYLEHDPVTVFKGWLLCEKLGSPYETRRQAALHMLADVWQLDRD